VLITLDLHDETLIPIDDLRDPDPPACFVEDLDVELRLGQARVLRIQSVLGFQWRSAAGPGAFESPAQPLHSWSPAGVDSIRELLEGRILKLRMPFAELIARHVQNRIGEDDELSF